MDPSASSSIDRIGRLSPFKTDLKMSTPTLTEKLDKIRSPNLQSQKQVCCYCIS